jgi:hypothetical protein
MKPARTIFAAMLASTVLASSAHAQTFHDWWWNSPYAPWRIQPGFVAPPPPPMLRQPCIPQPGCLNKYGAQAGANLGAPPPPPLAYASPETLPPSPPVATPEVCVVDPADIGNAPLLNVRDGPSGWPIGVLPNGAPVILSGEAAGPWVRLVNGGWVFRPLLACGGPPAAPGVSPTDAYAYQPARPSRSAPRPPASAPYERTPEDGTEPYSPPVRP